MPLLDSFSSFLSLVQKSSVTRGIQTWTVAVKCKDANHYNTTTTAQPFEVGKDFVQKSTG